MESKLLHTDPAFTIILVLPASRGASTPRGAMREIAAPVIARQNGLDVLARRVLCLGLRSVAPLLMSALLAPGLPLIERIVLWALLIILSELRLRTCTAADLPSPPP